ncbi:hypothetical protein D3C76_959280 [compost metagenome]
MANRIAVMVGLVGSDRILVPFGGEQAFPPDRFEALTDPANPGKKIDEGKRSLAFDPARKKLAQPLVINI